VVVGDDTWKPLRDAPEFEPQPDPQPSTSDATTIIRRRAPGGPAP
jgi:hypothetical protein